MLTDRAANYFGATGSLLVHLLIIAIALVVAQPRLDPRELQRPQIIQARLVELASTAEQPPAAQERVIDLTRRQPAPAQQSEQRIAQPVNETPKEASPVAEKAPEPKPEPVETVQQSPDEAELTPVRQREQDFASQLQAEAQAQADIADREQVMSYSALIEQKVAANWSRPPSARRGMVVELGVSLVPTGRVTEVKILKSSGDAAFDRSAEQAVRKAQPFDRLQELSTKVFEDNFRNFRFRFSPDDLRL